ncbi:MULTISPECIES: DUF1294 domain-containing protein [unclassified Duganella]|uniref:DUF1294 domain-containing protein n=1 Tax=unclassified Duganella TaxID=2636909 RepID=UPI00088D2BD3|nr:MULTISPECIES: DUF1294 domain-containing protein [unclassified Duganella]SDF62522.1 Uncharacterized membrane protein YsdA, DUF1294 family [Duganella sp. OV458]SDI65905.1 Uncharacterized membrane protein YsdA, DUF1294 family [Duganella sp. OV510]
MLWLASFYGVASVACFIAYALDKSAAIERRQRISERTLLLLGLFCGWPGALLAQRMLRHKSSKTSFLLKFWLTVLVNVALLVGAISQMDTSLANPP